MDLPEPHEGMTPEEKGALLLRYAAAMKPVWGLRFDEANLFRANISVATRLGFKLLGIDFQGVNLDGVGLSRSNLSGTNLILANLCEANLSEADLQGANLLGASLILANLQGADLQGANLRAADLKGADLQRAKLGEANLQGVDLQGANFQGANLEGSNLVNLKLTSEIVRATAGRWSTVDWRTIARSRHLEGLSDFLSRTGMPRVVATYTVEAIRSIDETDLFTMLQSVFLSYGRPDEEFAERLRKDLQENGVKTWHFPRDAVPGRRIHRHIEEEIHRFDRMVLCCSKASLVRPGVLHEVEEAAERERDESGSEVLIPILLEDIFESARTPPDWWPEGKGDIYRVLRRRVCADFREARYDMATWNEEFAKLLGALRKRDVDS